MNIPKTFLVAWFVWLLFYLSCLVALFCVAVHFVGKYW